MRLKINKRYRSLHPFESEELAPLTVITGLNGSGKTQLYEQFKLIADQGQGRSQAVLETIPIFKRIHFNELTTTLGIGSPQNYTAFLNGLHSQYLNEILHLNRIRIWKVIETKQLTVEDLDQELEKHKKGGVLIGNMFNIDKYEIDAKELELVTQFNTPDPFNNYLRLLQILRTGFVIYTQSKYVSKHLSKNLFDLSQSDFSNAVIPHHFIDQKDLINSRLENLFYGYLRIRRTNFEYQYRQDKHGDKNNALSDEDFNKQYPSPWKLINKIFKHHELGYHFSEIADKDFHSTSNIDFKLIKSSTGDIIPFDNLSSGEKVIIGLIIKLFTTEFYDHNLSFPDLIFLDEPDAHLHPHMSKLLIDVLNETIAGELGVQVIITTHSPSTVALAPDGSIYELQNGTASSLKKVNRDYALGILMKGLPNLSLDYKNHYQVFVESPTDIRYYQTLFEKIASTKKIIHQLYFISNGYGKSNRIQVTQIVKDLRTAGNNTSFGIVDWDLNDQHDSQIKIHGKGSRYSIENYIFDPLYLAILLIEKKYTDLMDHLNVKDTDNQFDIIFQVKGQAAIDYILEKLSKELPTEPKKTEQIICDYGDLKYSLPIWFLQFNGHDFKERLYKVFPPLINFKNKGEYELEYELIRIIGKSFPHVHSDTINIITTLTGIA